LSQPYSSSRFQLQFHVWITFYHLKNLLSICTSNGLLYHTKFSYHCKYTLLWLLIYMSAFFKFSILFSTVPNTAGMQIFVKQIN
jgi:hypothetical protein